MVSRGLHFFCRVWKESFLPVSSGTRRSLARDSVILVLASVVPLPSPLCLHHLPLCHYESTLVLTFRSHNGAGRGAQLVEYLPSSHNA
jgi:hypothetical protein